MQVEWNPQKRLENLKKHGVDFQDAALIFEDVALTAKDERTDYPETRWQALGHVDDDCFMVIHTCHGANRRIISAWRVNEEGHQRYTSILAD